MIACRTITLALIATGVSSAALGQAVQSNRTPSAGLRACIERAGGDEELDRCVTAYNAALRKNKTQGSKKPAVVSAIAKASSAGVSPNSTPEAAEKPDKCVTQSFFLRRDRSENFSFLKPCGPADVPGATVKYTNDRLAHSQNLNIGALVGYTVARDSGETFAITPSVYLSGVLAEPFKSTERNVARAALDSEFSIATPSFLHLIDIAPYVQTDFRGKGHIAGIDAIWEPYNPLLYLGGRDDQQRRRLVGFYWRLQGEADVLRVEKAGLTNFVSHTDHAFLGGTVQARMVFLQNMPEVGELLCGRIYASTTGQGFWDAETSHRRLSNFTGEVGYFLGGGVAPFWRYCVPRDAKGELPQPTASATSSSLSFVYTNGTDKINLVNQRQYKVQLNFRY
jgi:hypothetical protein